MKKSPISIIALTVFAIMAMQSCNSSSSKLDKFMGEWKSTNKTKKGEELIKKEDDAILLIGGKDTVVGLYNKKNDALKFWMNTLKFVVTINKKNGHLLVNNGKDGEATRVK